MGLFSKKSFADLQAEADEGQLRRSLGPWNLTALGIGSIIGTGIFVLTGTAASQNAGPALVLSMIISATGCAFSGLCYAEFSAMVPVAGSAYTYAYATIGEFVAWIIGWDLILEYALSVATVAVGWSGYFVSFARDVGIVVPAWLASPPPDGLFNLPAAAIVLVVAGLLVIGIKQSADTNTLLVAIKSIVLVIFVVAGASYVKRANLTPFIPPNLGPFGQFGWSGVLRGAGVMFFAYIGFDAVSTAAQEARNPARDMPIGILGSLAICTVIYIFVAVVLIGLVPYQQLNVADPLAVGIDATGITWLSPVVKVAALFGLFSTDAGPAAGSDPHLLLDEPRRFAAARVCGGPPALPHAAPQHHADRPDHRVDGGADADCGARATGEHRHAARIRAGQHRRGDPAPNRARCAAAVPDTLGAVRADCRCGDLPRADGGVAAGDVGASADLAGNRPGRLFLLFAPVIAAVGGRRRSRRTIDSRRWPPMNRRRSIRGARARRARIRAGSTRRSRS